MSHVIKMPQSYNPYELLRAYTYYRTILISILLVMFQTQVAAKLLGSEDPRLFLITSIAYTAFNFVTLVLLWRVKFLPTQFYLFVLLVVDFAAIILLMHASGGATNPIAYLLLITAAAGGILLRGQIAIFLSALGTIAVISESLVRALLNKNTDNFVAAGALGALLFLSAIIFQYLTKKILSSAEEALSQASHAANIQQLAQQIVERMRTGIIVLDKENQITLFNNAAAKLLNLSGNTTPRLSGSPELQEKLENWQRTNTNPSPILHADSDASDEVKVNFAKLDPDKSSHTLIFLEDNRAITQQAQHLKLASLGRLTASIAHEIRNPLSAISHAAQLLSEDGSFTKSNKRLLEIINTHTERVNQIIENVLQLSRRRTASPQVIRLDEWLPHFVEEYISTKSGENAPIIDCMAPDRIDAKFDLSQLQQVITNLVDNGLRYSAAPDGCAHLVIEAGIDKTNQQPYIKVIDFGPGVAPENHVHLFEPFFTTEHTGSGLGLYICKELCEANQALISYTHTHEGLSCFHIQLAHPDKSL